LSGLQKKGTGMNFSLIIPTYNESENIKIYLPLLLSVLENTTASFEIIVVDDNSPDLTWQVASEFSKIDSRIRVLRRFHGRGLSQSVLAGMEIAKGHYLGVIDADMQHDENILSQMLDAIQNYDIVIGSRMVSGGGYGNFSFIRRKISVLGTYLVQNILSLPISDPLSGYFIIRREIFESTASSINPRGFKILLEFLSRCRERDVKEIGYIFRNRKNGVTKLSPSVVEGYLAALVDLGFGNYFSWTFVKYGIVGVLGVGVNLIGQFFGNKILGLEKHNFTQDGYLVPGLAVGLGFILSLFHNFWLHNTWTFESQKKNGIIRIGKGFVLFLFVSLFGLMIQVSVWKYSHKLLSYFFSPEGVLTYFCNLFGIFAATVGNYYLNKNFTWKTMD
jgi:dolichol-phosphate mannosyltransferase